VAKSRKKDLPTDGQLASEGEAAHNAAIAEHLPDTSTEFDPATLERQSAAILATTDHAETVGKPVDHVLQRAKERFAPKHRPIDHGKNRLPNPHFTDSIALTDDKNGPRVHLGRGKPDGRVEVMLIKFDEKPTGEVGTLVLQGLRDNGFRFHGGAWTKDLDQSARWRTHSESHQLFKDIANTMREANGLPPVSETAGHGTPG
jgi:hypothetical protein